MYRIPVYKDHTLLGPSVVFIYNFRCNMKMVVLIIMIIKM